jgi:hypothetical protein
MLIHSEPARRTPPPQHYQDSRPRALSPPVPAVQKRMQSSGNLAPSYPVPGLQSNNQQTSHFKQPENMSETRAVLDQLAAIQRV